MSTCGSCGKARGYTEIMDPWSPEGMLKVCLPCYEKLRIGPKDDPADAYPRLSGDQREALLVEFRSTLNRHSVERCAGDTPDFVLAEYLVCCLEAWNAGLEARRAFYGGHGHGDRPYQHVTGEGAS